MNAAVPTSISLHRQRISSANASSGSKHRTVKEKRITPTIRKISIPVHTDTQTATTLPIPLRSPSQLLLRRLDLHPLLLTGRVTESIAPPIDCDVIRNPLPTQLIQLLVATQRPVTRIIHTFQLAADNPRQELDVFCRPYGPSDSCFAGFGEGTIAASECGFGDIAPYLLFDLLVGEAGGFAFEEERVLREALVVDLSVGALRG